MPAMSKRIVLLVAALVLICAAAATMKLYFIGITPSDDYAQYLSTGKAIAGDPSGEINAARILKPLCPLAVAALGIFVGFENAVVLQSVIFYAALVIVMFFMAREFFDDDWLAFYAALLVALSYPVLKYGIEGYSETGAWFFFALSLWLTLKLWRRPTVRIFLINVCVVTIGFLWKEYSIVGGLILAASFLLHPEFSIRTKIWCSIAAVAIFLGVHVPWELYVNHTYHFNYLKWSTTSVVGFSVEFTLKNVVKSLAAVLGLAWLLVPAGAATFLDLSTEKRWFLGLSSPFPFIAFAWGYISSRTFYVIAPPMILFAVHGMRTWPRPAQITIVALTIIGNVAWLFLSYSVHL